jgi:hypothetical protein
VQIRRVRYQVRKATQAITARRVPGGPLLIHKIVEARYRHHEQLLEAARRHSGLPPALAPRIPIPAELRHVAAAATAARVKPDAPLQPIDNEPEDSIPDGRPLVLTDADHPPSAASDPESPLVPEGEASDAVDRPRAAGDSK